MQSIATSFLRLPRIIVMIILVNFVSMEAANDRDWWKADITKQRDFEHPSTGMDMSKQVPACSPSCQLAKRYDPFPIE